MLRPYDIYTFRWDQWHWVLIRHLSLDFLRHVRFWSQQKLRWMFPKIVKHPKSSILVGFSIINHPFLGTPILGNPQVVNQQLPGSPANRILTPSTQILQRLPYSIEANCCTSPQSWKTPWIMVLLHLFSGTTPFYPFCGTTPFHGTTPFFLVLPHFNPFHGTTPFCRLSHCPPLLAVVASAFVGT